MENGFGLNESKRNMSCTTTKILAIALLALSSAATTTAFGQSTNSFTPSVSPSVSAIVIPFPPPEVSPPEEDSRKRLWILLGGASALTVTFVIAKQRIDFTSRPTVRNLGPFVPLPQTGSGPLQVNDSGQFA